MYIKPLHCTKKQKDPNEARMPIKGRDFVKMKAVEAAREHAQSQREPDLVVVTWTRTKLSGPAQSLLDAHGKDSDLFRHDEAEDEGGKYHASLHPNWQEVSIKEPEWTMPLEIIKDNLREMVCLMMQQSKRSMKKNRNSRWKLKDSQNRKETQAWDDPLHLPLRKLVGVMADLHYQYHASGGKDPTGILCGLQSQRCQREWGQNLQSQTKLYD